VDHYIYVAGVDYEFKGVVFRRFCDSRLRRTVAANRARRDMRFLILDVIRGEVVTTDVTFPGGRKAEATTSATPFRPVSRASYDAITSGTETHYRFKPGQTDVMGIVDVYNAVRHVGAIAPGQLRELSVFSHGWMGGPILVNSFDDRSARIPLPPPLSSVIPHLEYVVPATHRDPDDKDPRAALDFIAPTMDAAARAELHGAFHPSGYIWLWGCAFPRLIHQILHRLERNPAYRERGLPADTILRFTNFLPQEVDLLERYLAAVLPPFPDRRRIDVAFKYLKHFACVATQASYTQHLATAAGVKVYGALLGTYSEYDTGRLPLMHVRRQFGAHFRFYKNYLGFDLDPEGRRYGTYRPALACPAP
jgi:hypothetical protein